MARRVNRPRLRPDQSSWVKAIPIPAWAIARLEAVRTSFWIMPTLMAAAAFAAASFMPWIDSKVESFAFEGWIWWFIYTGNPDAARMMLSTIAGSTIGLAGTVFAITVAALSLAGSQLGPRLLRTFTSDRGNQFTLGAFIGTFVYCLLGLRHISGTAGADGAWVPQLTVTVGMALALLSIGVLVWFIHHLCRSIQAPVVLDQVGEVYMKMIDDLSTLKVGESPPSGDDGHANPRGFFSDDDAAVVHITAQRSGYAEAIDYRELFELAEKNELTVKLLCRPGTWVFETLPIVAVRPRERLSGETRKECELLDELGDCLYVSGQRTLAQDLEFGRDQVIEVGVRALSPGINDPFTAMTCLDHLASALIRYLSKEPPARHRYDEAGNLRLIIQQVDFAGLVSGSFNLIRHSARDNLPVQLRLLEVIAKVGQAASTDAQRQALWQEASLVLEDMQDHLPAGDREAVEAREASLRRVLLSDEDDADSTKLRRE